MSLPKSERLKSRSAINALFDNRKSVRNKHLKAVYKFIDCNDNTNSNLITVTVPKKKIKTAVKRILIKRRVREAYRINKSIFNKKENQQLHLMFLYLHNEVIEYHQIEASVIAILKKIS